MTKEENMVNTCTCNKGIFSASYHLINLQLIKCNAKLKNINSAKITIIHMYNI